MSKITFDVNKSNFNSLLDRLSELQKLFAQEMIRLNQNYACLWTIEQIDNWAIECLGLHI
mgnify:CR=1 FL=1